MYYVGVGLVPALIFLFIDNRGIKKNDLRIINSP